MYIDLAYDSSTPRSVSTPSDGNRVRSARINFRTTLQAKAMIERAATLMGTTVSGFVLQNAYEAARRVVADDDSLVLSQRAFQSFVADCEKPCRPTDALRNLMDRR